MDDERAASTGSVAPARTHNQQQQQYFERAEHRTLKPASSRYLRRHVSAMTEFARIRPGDRVLEVGAGLGRNTLLLAEQGVAIEALDLSAQLLERLDAYNGGRFDIPLHSFDLVDAPPEMSGRYDAVVGFFVLHHVHDVETCLAAAARLVRPGGWVAFMEPNPWNPLYYVQITCTPEMSWDKERGMMRMKPKYLNSAMQAAALTNLSQRYFGFFPPFITNRRIGEKAEAAIERVPFGRSFRPFLLFGGQRPLGDHRPE